MWVLEYSDNNDSHVIPVERSIHTMSDDCVCGPAHEEMEDGTFLYTHAALDQQT